MFVLAMGVKDVMAARLGFRGEGEMLVWMRGLKEETYERFL
jgi:hypothetical protein